MVHGAVYTLVTGELAATDCLGSLQLEIENSALIAFIIPRHVSANMVPFTTKSAVGSARFKQGIFLLVIPLSCIKFKNKLLW